MVTLILKTGLSFMFSFFLLLVSTVGASLPVANWLSLTPQKMCMKLELFGKKSLPAPCVMGRVEDLIGV